MRSLFSEHLRGEGFPVTRGVSASMSCFTFTLTCHAAGNGGRRDLNPQGPLKHPLPYYRRSSDKGKGGKVVDVLRSKKEKVVDGNHRNETFMEMSRDKGILDGRCCRAANDQFLERILWAFRTMLACLVAYAAMVASGQQLFPGAILSPIIAIVCTQSTTGGTLIFGKKLITSVFTGSIVSVPLHAILHAIFPRIVFAVAIPFIVFLGVFLLMSLKRLPLNNIASLVFSLVFGLPALSSQATPWYFGFLLAFSIASGVFFALIAVLIPLPKLPSAVLQLKTCSEKAKKCVGALLKSVKEAIETNNIHTIANAEVLSLELEQTLTKASALLRPAFCENLFLCRASRRAVCDLEFLISQHEQLSSMVRLIGIRAGKPISAEQVIFLEQTSQDWNEIINELDPWLNNPDFHAPQVGVSRKIYELLDSIKLSYRLARIRCLYSFDESASREFNTNVDEKKRDFVDYSPKVSEGEDNTETENFIGDYNASNLIGSLGIETWKRISNRHANFQCFCNFAESAANYLQRDNPPSSHTLFCCTRKDIPTFAGIRAADLRKPFKLALTLGLSAIWFVIPVLRQEQLNGFWVTVTICFVTQNNIGSSIGKVFNRLIGTVLSCGLCLVALRLSSTYYAGAVFSMALIVFAASLFRGLPEHGYAALTLAFTTPLLLFGGSEYVVGNKLEHFIVARVEMTVIGCALYLFIEILIWPIKPRKIIRGKIRNFFRAVAKFFEHASRSIEDLSCSVEEVAKDKDEQSRPVCETLDIETEVEIDGQGAIDFEMLMKSEQEMSTCVAATKSFLIAAANEPSLQDTSTFPLFLWKKLVHSLEYLCRTVNRISYAMRKLEAKRYPGVDQDQLLFVGRHLFRDLHHFASQISEKVSELEPQLRRRDGLQGTAHQPLIDLVELFESSQLVKRGLETSWHNYYDNFFREKFESWHKLYNLNQQSNVIDADSFEAANVDSSQKNGIQDDKIAGMMPVLDQNNSLLLSSIIIEVISTTDYYAEIGADLKNIWL